ncbi:uncharacterized protein B0P05DRAFT_557965 [Gilbertella persicaria]|uniref:uncharacterized protein n=1 Tax=Gilbertella persicaria TaxID=101096 RepID=UPI00221EB21E|nr:uncharacterized protein B0P05DRAFT_557965 [Gilbertella persicaria]KAI8060392.1 hypothetical protein B0P05DRAFT_557965 [Gilbertella persicaria]
MFCQICNQLFATRAIYKEHTRMTQKQRTTPAMPNKNIALVNPLGLKKPDYHCGACNKVYKRKSQYLRHLAKAHSTGVERGNINI